ncbi:flavin reductase family protein [Limnoglobus roseus]|uniref:Flavin reductase family protein n=1 Tax=Limnoglobus roseus TaxID=2598579 RepID=A0A5C1ABN4_9BACT|nr:flavin reductase family protein [Limnoglobus roseus]QEL16661.1 flavin reductase family protein [Limnoglobus roseus]
MKAHKKADFPTDHIRRFLEPGPVVLVSFAHAGERDIMTMGWHTILGYNHIGCYIWDQNHSRKLTRASKDCVFNVPTFELIDAVIGVGNTHGPEADKFAVFGLTPAKAKTVGAPRIAECFASFECRLVDDSQADKYSLFTFECVRAHVATSPKYPKTVHYRGDGVFMIAGENKSYRRTFKPEML